MDSFFNAVIVDNTILFFLTVLLFLLLTVFPEVLKKADLTKIKRFFI